MIRNVSQVFDVYPLMTENVSHRHAAHHLTTNTYYKHNYAARHCEWELKASYFLLSLFVHHLMTNKGSTNLAYNFVSKNQHKST